MPVDLDKLAKITALIASPSDGEALTAARKADQMVRDAGMTWADVLGRGQSRESNPAVPATLKGTLTVVRESVASNGAPMAMLSMASQERVHQDLIAFGSLATWIADSVRAMPLAVFIVQLEPPRQGFRFHKIAHCVRT